MYCNIFGFSVWYGCYFSADFLLCDKYEICYTVMRICVSNKNLISVAP